MSSDHPIILTMGKGDTWYGLPPGKPIYHTEEDD